MDGVGTYTFADGSVLSEFKNNAFLSGTYRVSDEIGTYLIQYADGQMTSAQITFTDGTVYSRRICCGQISGDGTIQYPNGDSYSGSYQDGKRDGDGTYLWNSGDYYEETGLVMP